MTVEPRRTNTSDSDELQRFVAVAPAERQPILELMRQAAASLNAGQRVVDIGAGNSPYRGLFAHVEYVSVDWEQSVHEGARHVDVIASAEAVPLPDKSFDAVLLTQVLEHVSEPEIVLQELFRLLVPGGRIYLTAPLVWELHEMPYDYYRYTESALVHLLTGAGFVDVEIKPKSDSFTSLAQLMRNVAWTMGASDDGLELSRVYARDQTLSMADTIEGFAPLDIACVLPLGYCATAARSSPTSDQVA